MQEFHYPALGLAKAGLGHLQHPRVAVPVALAALVALAVQTATNPKNQVDDKFSTLTIYQNRCQC